jgi:hypothetical protein
LRLRDAQTNGELWLAFPSGDDARNGKNDSWTLYHHLLQDRPELAQIRGTGGVVNRLGIVALRAVGMLFFLLLLVYVAANLLLASLFFVVLLLLAPVMLLFPCFGETGRRAFWRWLGYATGALLAKVIYALYLGVLLFASAVVGGIGVQDGGWLLEWILFAALWGLAFAYRGRMLALLSLGGHREHHRGIEAAAATMGAVALTRATGRRVVTPPTRRLVDEHLELTAERIDVGVDYAGSGEIDAVGNATIVFAGTGIGGGRLCSTPANGGVVYQLTDGQYQGDYVYVIEDVIPTVHPGDSVTAGEQVATFISLHGCLEIGFANGPGPAPKAAALGQQAQVGDAGDNRTYCGQQMSDLLAATGAPAGLPEGRPITGDHCE